MLSCKFSYNNYVYNIINFLLILTETESSSYKRFNIVINNFDPPKQTNSTNDQMVRESQNQFNKCIFTCGDFVCHQSRMFFMFLDISIFFFPYENQRWERDRTKVKTIVR